MQQSAFQDSTLALARDGDSAAFQQLFAPLRGYARKLARRFFAPGFDQEDLYQEALAGFAVALLGYRPEKMSFEDFARLSMRNTVVACVRRATRQKRSGAVLAGLDLSEFAAAAQTSPELVVERRSECAEVLESLRTRLSPLEWGVLTQTVAGVSLDEIASRWNLPRRRVENALARARAKARQLRRTA